MKLKRTRIPLCNACESYNATDARSELEEIRLACIVRRGFFRRHRVDEDRNVGAYIDTRHEVQ